MHTAIGMAYGFGFVVALLVIFGGGASLMIWLHVSKIDFVMGAALAMTLLVGAFLVALKTNL